MKSLSPKLYVVFAACSLGSLGCGAAVPGENVDQVQEKATIAGWTDLVNMNPTTNYTLTVNIDASGRTWTPKDYSAIFDGGNHTISNLTVSNGGFFRFLSNATIKNIRFTNLRITGSSLGVLGALGAQATDTTVDNSAVEFNVNVSAIATGGFFGTMDGGSIHRSYAKGTLGGRPDNAGGFIGIASTGSFGGVSITESYAQVTVNGQLTAGGLVASATSTDFHDVYAVGNVTGRNAVGGIVGNVNCDPNFGGFLLYKTIYRGNVVDLNKSGWAGAVGTFEDCTGRMEQNFYDRSLDPSGTHANHHSIQGFTTFELQSPTTVTGGVFCAPDVIPGRCGDNTWSSPPWTAGTSQQHHALLNMPGPNIQPR